MPEFQLPPLDQIITKSFAILAILVGAIVVKFLLNRGLSLLAERTRLTRSDIAPLSKIVGWLIAGIAIVLILGVFNIPLTGIWAVLSTVLAMVAIGFVAVWSLLSNVSCTVMILFFRPFSIGDSVEFAGEPVSGRVVDLNFLYTTLRTEDGTLMQVPNNMFFQKVLKRRRGEGAVSLAEQLSSAEAAK